MQFSPMRLTSIREPFDHPEFIYQLKWDGCRCLAEVHDAAVRLWSRHGNEYKRFEGVKSGLSASVRRRCVLGGEIACLDGEGRPQFYDLLRRRGDPVFVALDILSLDGCDLRPLELLARKRGMLDCQTYWSSAASCVHRRQRRRILPPRLRHGLRIVRRPNGIAVSESSRMPNVSSSSAERVNPSGAEAEGIGRSSVRPPPTLGCDNSRVASPIVRLRRFGKR